MTELSNEAGPSKPRMLEVHQPQGIAAFADDGVHTRTLYVPIVSPPTPSPSPGPSTVSFTPPTPLPDVLPSDEIADASLREFAALAAHGPAARRRYLTRMLGACSPAELLFVSTALAPLLKRDIVGELPPELALHVLGYVSDHRTLVAGGRVSRSWRALCHEDTLWKDLTGEYGFTQETERARRQAIALGKPPLPYRVGFQYCQTSGMYPTNSGV
jgi:F-box and WD-40 domain protein CDC4